MNKDEKNNQYYIKYNNWLIFMELMKIKNKSMVHKKG